MELFEQTAQRERRPERPIRHDRRGHIMLAINLPIFEPWRSGWPRIALRPARPWFALVAALAAHGDHLPVGTGTQAGFILACNERRAVGRDDIQLLVARLRVESAADSRHTRIEPSRSKANPVVAMRRCAGSVAQRLPGGAEMHHHVAFVVHGLGRVGLDNRQLASRAGIAPVAFLAGRAGNAGLSLRSDRASRSTAACGPWRAYGLLELGLDRLLSLLV